MTANPRCTDDVQLKNIHGLPDRRGARRRCRRECRERRGPTRKEGQRGERRENHTKRIEAPGVRVIRDAAAGERRHRQREDAERDPVSNVLQT